MKTIVRFCKKVILNYLNSDFRITYNTFIKDY